MARRVQWRLSGMMALIYAVQGAWWPMLAIHLDDLQISGRARGWIFATMAMASIATPLGAGFIADRRMPTQRLLALIYFLGTGLLVLVGMGQVTTAGPLFGLFLAYWLLTAPATGLASSLAFRNLPEPARQFGGVRLWGTIGWMCVGWLVSAAMVRSGSLGSGQGTPEAFWLAAVLSGLFAVYCLTLPHTPPLASSRSGATQLLGALKFLRNPPVAIYLAIAFGVCLTTAFVYQAVPTYLYERGLPRNWIASALTLGQVPEVLSLAALPWLLRRLGTRRTLAFGISAWACYFGVLMVRPPLFVALAAILLNGVAVACFSVVGQLYIDGAAPGDRRAGAQSLYIVATSGAGTFLGSLLAGEVLTWFPGDIASAFLVPCLIDLVLLCALFFAFWPEAQTVRRPTVAQAALRAHLLVRECLMPQDAARQ
jgi:MFS family permease